MKKNDRVQLKSAGMPELEKRVHDAREKLWTLQRDIQAGKAKNVHEAAALRKDIARMLTQMAASATPQTLNPLPQTL